MHVIPAVNAASIEEAEAQCNIVSKLGHWIHLDVVDGVFAKNKTWGSPEELEKLKAKNVQLKTAHLEVHLMVNNPEEEAKKWIHAADRIIVHVEALQNKRALLATLKEKNVEAMLAIEPKTPSAKLLPYATDFKFFQVLAVPSGRAGQSFDPSSIERIKFLREHAPDAIIEVDGGMNPNTVRLCREAGAHIFVAASYILKSNDSLVAYQELLKSAGH